jgi:hypothetical protein
MANQTWVNLLNAGAPWQTTAGTALTSSATTATISPQAPGPQDFVMPQQPNGLQWYPGMTIKIEAGGTLLAGGTTSGLTVFLACGVSGTLAQTLTTSGVLTLGTAVTTAVGWHLDAVLRVLAIGSTGSTLTCGGVMTFPTVALSNVATLGTANATILNLPETAVSWNTYPVTNPNTALGLRATLSAAFGSVQCNQFLLYQVA